MATSDSFPFQRPGFLKKPGFSTAVVLAACLSFTGCWNSDNSDDSAATPAVSVQTAKAELITLRPKLQLVGTIVAVPERTAVMSPQLGGWVSKLGVVEGQSIKADDVLVELDPRSARVAVQRAQALVAEKTATVERLKSGYLPAEIAGARQDANKASATVKGLSNELTALKDLLDRHEMSSVLYETKAKALESAEAAAASAQERVKLLEAGTRTEMIDEAQALLDAAEADREQAKLALQWCSITSPIDGVVTQLLARQGQFFDRAASLATIIDLSNVFVRLRIPSREFGKVQIGAKVEIQLTSIPGRTFQGTVQRISGTADPQTGNVIVFALIKNDDHVLRPGLGCQARMSLPEVPDALAIPIAAIADNSGTPVVTVIRDGKAYETEVDTGIQTHDFIQILQGLSAGDLVATAGGYGLPTGCPVNVVSDEEATSISGQ